MVDDGSMAHTQILDPVDLMRYQQWVILANLWYRNHSLFTLICQLSALLVLQGKMHGMRNYIGKWRNTLDFLEWCTLCVTRTYKSDTRYKWPDAYKTTWWDMMAQGQEWPEFQPSRRKANNANCHIVLTAKEPPPLHLFSKTTQEM